MTKKERKKKKRQIIQLRKLAKAVEVSHNKFYWVAYKSLKGMGASYSKQLCPTKRYRLRGFKEIVIPYPNRKKRIFVSSSASLHRMSRSLGNHYAKIFFKYFPHDTKEIITKNANNRAFSDEEIETLKKVFPNVDFTTHKEVVRKK